MKEVIEKLKGAKQSGENIRAVCPWCSHTRAFIWNLDTGWFCCFRCNEKGNITKLMNKLAFNPYAVSIAAKRFINKFKPRKVETTRRVEEAYSLLPEYLLSMYKTNRKLLPDQFTKETEENFDIGFDRVDGRITFPVRDYMGNLVAISGRATMGWQRPRYQTYKFPAVPNYEPQNRRHLYLFDQVYPKHYLNPNYNGMTVIVEGFKAALWCQQNGYDVVAVQGSQITKQQLSWISKIGGEKVILLDNEAGKHMQDQEGKSESHNMLMRLLRNRNTASVARYPDNSQDLAPDDLDPDQLSWTINNRVKNVISPKWKRKIK